MPRLNNLHSRLVAWMKIILPLAALGLLSTLFLLSRTIDPSKSVPVTAIDIEQRAREQGATSPVFAGVTENDDLIEMRATKARPIEGDMQHLLADDVDADIKPPDGGLINVIADSGDVRQREFTATLVDNVVVTTDRGYRMTTEILETRFDTIFAESPVPVQGTGPLGDIEANRMVLISDDETGDAHLLFTGEVKVIYQPENTGD